MSLLMRYDQELLNEFRSQQADQMKSMNFEYHEDIIYQSYNNYEQYNHTIVISGNQLKDYDLFLLHGLMATHNVYLELSSSLLPQFKRIILINNLGSGGSSRKFNPDCSSTIEIIKFTNSMLDRIMIQQNSNKIVLGGHSLGAYQTGHQFLFNKNKSEDISKKFNIVKLIHISPFGQTSSNKLELQKRDRRNDGIYEQQIGLSLRQTFFMVGKTFWQQLKYIFKVKFIQYFSSEWWAQSKLMTTNIESKKFHKKLIQFNFSNPSQIDQFAALKLSNEYGLANNSLEDAIDRNINNITPNTIITIFGDHDWMNQDGARRLMKKGIVKVEIVNNSMHSPQIDNPLGVATIIIDHLE